MTYEQLHHAAHNRDDYYTDDDFEARLLAIVLDREAQDFARPLAVDVVITERARGCARYRRLN